MKFYAKSRISSTPKGEKLRGAYSFTLMKSNPIAIVQPISGKDNQKNNCIFFSFESRVYILEVNNNRDLE